MAIYYSEENKTFTLSTENTTYQMKVDTYGVLIHTYYGAAVGQEDMSYLVDLRDSGFSGRYLRGGKQKRLFPGHPAPGVFQQRCGRLPDFQRQRPQS